MIGALDTADSVMLLFTFGPDGLVSRLAASVRTYYAFDERGNVAQRLSSTGAVTSSDLYDGYGARTNTASVQPDPFGYGGEFGYFTDTETGLLLLTHRFYDPAAGRFVTRDPIGYDGGINLYSYTQNNPGNWMDPMGTNRFTDWYMNGMGGLSPWVDDHLMNGSTANLGQVSGEYDSGCASGWDLAGAGAKFGGNLALNVIPGGGEARAAEVGTELAVHAAEDVAGGISKDVLKEAEGRTFAVDPHGNTIPLEPGETLVGSPNGKFLQVRDAAGNPTGMRIDGPHNPIGHPDPRAQLPHAHVPGRLNEDGTPWLPINR